MTARAGFLFFDFIMLGMQITHGMIFLLIPCVGLIALYIIRRGTWLDINHRATGITVGSTVALLIVWRYSGMRWLDTFWMVPRWLGWAPYLSPLSKLFWQPVILSARLGLLVFAIRQLQEASDPAHTIRHTNNPDGVGLAPNWPLRWIFQVLLDFHNWLGAQKGEPPAPRDIGMPIMLNHRPVDSMPLPILQGNKNASAEERRRSLESFCAGVIMGNRELSRDAPTGMMAHGFSREYYNILKTWLLANPTRQGAYGYMDGKDALHLTELGIDLFTEAGAQARPEIRNHSPAPEEEE